MNGQKRDLLGALNQFYVPKLEIRYTVEVTIMNSGFYIENITDQYFVLSEFLPFWRAGYLIKYFS